MSGIRCVSPVLAARVVTAGVSSESFFMELWVLWYRKFNWFPSTRLMLHISVSSRLLIVCSVVSAISSSVNSSLVSIEYLCSASSLLVKRVCCVISCVNWTIAGFPIQFASMKLTLMYFISPL